MASSILGRVLAIVLAVAAAGRLGLGVIAYRTANALERPSYSVVRQLGGGVELRRYSPYLIAETSVRADSMREASGKGFREVAGYVFGKNRPATKMAMTAPVRMSSDPRGGVPSTTRVSFVLEKSYSRRTAPAPLRGQDVRVRSVAPHLLAARSFSGPPPSEMRVSSERQRVLDALSAAGLRPASDGETLLYGYHDPFITPSFMRKNEVAVRVEDSAAEVRAS